MKQRILLARFLISLGGFIRSLAVTLMRPDDLIEFTRQAYTQDVSITKCGRRALVESSLHRDELELFEKIHIRKGRFLVLGVGGGREAIPFAHMGFEVTGLDFVPEMVERAKENAAKKGLKITGLVQDISKIQLPENSYDIIWLSAAMYSCIPTQKRRVEMLKRINKGLKPDGYFVCQFQMQQGKTYSRMGDFFRRTFAFVTLGNLSYERGDMLWGGVEFIHAFASEQELRQEFENGRFEVKHFCIPESGMRGGAVLKRA